MRKKIANLRPRADLNELQQMWLSLMRGSWSSLAVVPTDPDLSPRAVTGALTEIAGRHEVAPFQIIDAVGASPARCEGLAREMASVLASGSRAVVAVDSVIQSPGGVSLVRDAQAALLVFRLGSTSPENVQSTIEVVGQERILGSVAVPP